MGGQEGQDMYETFKHEAEEGTVIELLLATLSKLASTEFNNRSCNIARGDVDNLDHFQLDLFALWEAITRSKKSLDLLKNIWNVLKQIKNSGYKNWDQAQENEFDAWDLLKGNKSVETTKSQFAKWAKEKKKGWTID